MLSEDGTEIASIGFNPFSEDGERRFAVYSALKSGQYGWIFVLNYSAPYEKNNSLDSRNSSSIDDYLKIIGSAKPVAQLESSVQFELLRAEIPQLILDEHRRINTKFDTTFGNEK